MNQHQNQDSSEVLLHFAMESNPGKATLDRYLHEYPELAEDLVELSRQLLSERKTPPVTELHTGDKNLIEKAWQRFQTGISASPYDPFESLTVAQAREVAVVLEISRSVLSAIRDRVVLEASIPRAFLRNLAAQVGSPLDDLSRFLAIPPTCQPAQNYKAEEKPQTRDQITFKELLIQAKTPPEVMEKLLKED